MSRKDDPGADSGCSPASGGGPEGAPACGPSCCCGGQSSQGLSRRSGLRTIIFVAVIAAAIAVAVWSLFVAKRAPAPAGSEVGRPGEAAGGTTAAALIRSVPTLAEMAPGKDFAFVLFPGADSQETAAVANVVQRVSATLASRGVQAAAITVGTSDAGFLKMAKAFGVEKFPAVVLLGKSCPSVVAAQITEDGLLKDYVRATCASGCAPGACSAEAAASGCCPGK